MSLKQNEALIDSQVRLIERLRVIVACPCGQLRDEAADALEACEVRIADYKDLLEAERRVTKQREERIRELEGVLGWN